MFEMQKPMSIREEAKPVGRRPPFPSLENKKNDEAVSHLPSTDLIKFKSVWSDLATDTGTSKGRSCSCHLTKLTSSSWLVGGIILGEGRGR
jgi:hypothetical protein